MENPVKDYRGLLLPSDPQSQKKPSGVILMDGVQVADTAQCVHCGYTWIVVKGSGRERGWCLSCDGPFCGRKCEPCYPFQKKLDDYEKGKLIVLR